MGGVMAAKCGHSAIEFVPEMLRACSECVATNSERYRAAPICVGAESEAKQQTQSDGEFARRQFLAVIDNAMATICKILVHIDWAKAEKLAPLRNECLSVWLRHLPLKSDVVEAKECHSYLFKLVTNKNPIVLGENLSNLPEVLKVFAKVRNTPLSSQELDGVVAQFARTICQSQPVFAQGLTAQERTNLGL